MPIAPNGLFLSFQLALAIDVSAEVERMLAAQSEWSAYYGSRAKWH